MYRVLLLVCLLVAIGASRPFAHEATELIRSLIDRADYADAMLEACKEARAKQTAIYMASLPFSEELSQAIVSPACLDTRSLREPFVTYNPTPGSAEPVTYAGYLGVQKRYNLGGNDTAAEAFYQASMDVIERSGIYAGAYYKRPITKPEGVLLHHLLRTAQLMTQTGDPVWLVQSDVANLIKIQSLPVPNAYGNPPWAMSWGQEADRYLLPSLSGRVLPSLDLPTEKRFLQLMRPMADPLYFAIE